VCGIANTVSLRSTCCSNACLLLSTGDATAAAAVLHPPRRKTATGCYTLFLFAKSPSSLLSAALLLPATSTFRGFPVLEVFTFHVCFDIWSCLLYTETSPSRSPGLDPVPSRDLSRVPSRDLSPVPSRDPNLLRRGGFCRRGGGGGHNPQNSY
jgi:hypothetical protein